MICDANEVVLKEAVIRLKRAEKIMGTDVLYMNGPMLNGLENIFKDYIEDLRANSRSTALSIFLTTTGGSAEVVERMVNIVRYNYREVNFVIPDYAYSAGTIFCMSGDSILMDYSSVLGPIDPQVQTKDGKMASALGYLDRIKELLERAKEKDFTEAEYLILKEFDHAEIKLYEQARDLTVDLLKKWLVTYKFKNWEKHTSTGLPVTEDEKKERAEDIARDLGNYSKWKSHGRPISIEDLSILKLKIDDYSDKMELRTAIQHYYGLATDYMQKNRMEFFLQTRRK